MLKIKQSPPWLRPVVEYGPIVAFFITYYMADLFAATASIMITAALALALSYIVERRIPMMPLITAVIRSFWSPHSLASRRNLYQNEADHYSSHFRHVPDFWASGKTSVLEINYGGDLAYNGWRLVGSNRALCFILLTHGRFKRGGLANTKH